MKDDDWLKLRKVHEDYYNKIISQQAQKITELEKTIIDLKVLPDE